MLARPNLFLRPVPWGIGPGPASVHSIDHAIHVVDMWLTVTPDRMASRPLRRRMLVLRDILDHAQEDPDEADLQSAKLAIKGTVRFARDQALPPAPTAVMTPRHGPLH